MEITEKTKDTPYLSYIKNDPNSLLLYYFLQQQNSSTLFKNLEE